MLATMLQNPKKKPGFLLRQLVAAVTTLASIQSWMGVNRRALAQARTELDEIRNSLADTLPHYMVPAGWVVLETMPIIVSGKLDRQRLARWIEGLTDTTYERIARAIGVVSAEGDGNGNHSAVEVAGPAKTLREIWAIELHLPVDRVEINRAFLSLGKFAFL